MKKTLSQGQSRLCEVSDGQWWSVMAGVGGDISALQTWFWEDLWDSDVWQEASTVQVSQLLRKFLVVSKVEEFCSSLLPNNCCLMCFKLTLIHLMRHYWKDWSCVSRPLCPFPDNVSHIKSDQSPDRWRKSCHCIPYHSPQHCRCQDSCSFHFFHPFFLLPPPPPCIPLVFKHFKQRL